MPMRTPPPHFEFTTSDTDTHPHPRRGGADGVANKPCLAPVVEHRVVHARPAGERRIRGAPETRGRETDPQAPRTTSSWRGGLEA
ncbi:hypothetical protein B0H12DRAFT_1143324 [Mycena haematopus]|nr:hypothetical protein B0H12DRAFT_1143324 [Mycena haematopus]